MTVGQLLAQDGIQALGTEAVRYAARVRAREERIRANRAAVCGVCSSDLSSAALQLQRPRSRMS